MTPFAKKVYRAVLKIPLGEVRSYKWVAREAGRPRAYRAVGQILKRNPLPLLIPCHRVVHAHKASGGYIWGIRTKRQILNLESKLKRLMV